MTMTAVDTTYVSSMLVKTRKLQLICCDYIIAKYVLANLHMSSSECVSSSDNVTAGYAGIGRYGSVMSLIDVDMPSCRRLSPGQPGPGHTRITSCRKRRKALLVQVLVEPVSVTRPENVLIKHSRNIKFRLTTVKCIGDDTTAAIARVPNLLLRKTIKHDMLDHIHLFSFT